MGSDTVGRMTYALEVKELPGQDDPAAQADPTQPAPPEPTDDAPRWAGDLYEEGDESTPEGSQWSFTGDQGEQAWLDRSDDGTVMGWVRAADGQVFRYTDADAWAVDVDDSGMVRDAGGADTGGELGADEGGDPNEATDPAQGDEFVDPDGDQGDVDEDAAYDAVMGDEEDPEADAEADDIEEDPEADPGEAEPDADEDDEEDPDAPDGNPFAKKKKGRKIEGKVLRLDYR